MKYKITLYVETKHTFGMSLREAIRDKIHELPDVLIGIIVIKRVKEWMKRIN